MPVDPVRILDTRDPGQIGRLWPGWTVEGQVPSDAAGSGGGVVVNLTGVDFRAPATSRCPRRASAAGHLEPELRRSRTGRAEPGDHTDHARRRFPGVLVRAAPTSIVDYTGYYTGTPLIPTVSQRRSTRRRRRSGRHGS